MPLYPQGGGLYPNSIDNVLLADMPANTVKGRAAGTGTGDPQDLPMSSLIAASAGLSYRNILGRNGGFEVWQRGAGGSAAFGIAASGSQYVADGWFVAVNANQVSTVSQQQGRVAGSRYSLAYTRNPGQTGVGSPLLEYPLDSDEIALMQGSVVTLSLILQALPNWSPASGNIQINLYVGTGTPARRALGTYTGETIPISAVQPLTQTMTRYSFTSSVAIPANTTQASVLLTWTPVGTAGASDGFYIDDVQLEVGSIATPFERRPFESELLACQRHYQKTFPYAIAPVAGSDYGGYFSFNPKAGAVGMFAPSAIFSPAMRSSPTATLYNPSAANAQIRNKERSVDHTSTVVASMSERSFLIQSTGTASELAGELCQIQATFDAGI